MEKPWFKSKSFGYGWTPATKEGWIVTIGFIAAILWVAFKYAEADTEKYLFYMFVLITLLVFIAYKTGEKPEWRWGKKKE